MENKRHSNCLSVFSKLLQCLSCEQYWGQARRAGVPIRKIVLSLNLYALRQITGRYQKLAVLSFCAALLTWISLNTLVFLVLDVSSLWAPWRSTLDPWPRRASIGVSPITFGQQEAALYGYQTTKKPEFTIIRENRFQGISCFSLACQDLLCWYLLLKWILPRFASSSALTLALSSGVIVVDIKICAMFPLHQLWMFLQGVSNAVKVFLKWSNFCLNLLQALNMGV